MKVLQVIGEYSYSIYLGHAIVMFIMSKAQELLHFSNAKLAIMDLIGCLIFIPFLPELIDKSFLRWGGNKKRI